MNTEELSLKIVLLKQIREDASKLNDELLAFCRDKEGESLSLRWEVWTSYVKKEKNIYIPSFRSSPIDGIIRSGIADLSRHEEISHDWMLETVEEQIKEQSLEESLINVLKEELIEQNMGSFIIDW